MAPRRKRPGDQTRNRSRPTRSQRRRDDDPADAATGMEVTVSSDSEEAHPTAGTRSARPLTARLRRPYATSSEDLDVPAGSVSITVPDDVPTGHSQGPVGSGLTPFEDASSAVAALHFIGPVGSFRPDAPRVQSTVTDLTVDLTDDSNERRETLKPTPKVRGRIHAGGVARPATLVEEELREERERVELRVEVHGMPTRLQATSLPADPSAVIDWNHAWTLVVEGRPLYPRVDFMLLRQDLVIGAMGQTQEHPAPTTPPWVHEGMRRRARLDSVAPLALARAEAEGNDGEGTPPTAFVQDVAVRQYRDAWMYMVHGMGQGLIHCLWDGSLSVSLNCAVAEQAHVPCPDTASPLEETVCLPIHQSYSLTYRGTPWAG
eukprot:s4528_g1.t1